MRIFIVLAFSAILASFGARAATLSGDSTQGARLYRACASCHSLSRNRNMTGPSLAGVWGRKAGSLKSFERYSSALKASGIIWTENTLDQWLKSPAQFIPGNHMAFAGIPNAQQRADIIALLKEASSGAMSDIVGGMAPKFQDLKKLGSNRQVQSIRVCRDSYFVTTADGKTTAFWEANLRFKTDSSSTGPLSGKPVILPAGMMGDRASVFFASPEEISPFIKHRC